MSGPNDFWSRDMQAAGAQTPQEQRQNAAEARASAAEGRASAADARAARSEARSQQEFEAKFGTVAAPGDTTKTGEDYLATIDPQVANAARMYIDGGGHCRPVWRRAIHKCSG